MPQVQGINDSLDNYLTKNGSPEIGAIIRNPNGYRGWTLITGLYLAKQQPVVTLGRRHLDQRLATHWAGTDDGKEFLKKEGALPSNAAKIYIFGGNEYFELLLSSTGDITAGRILTEKEICREVI